MVFAINLYNFHNNFYHVGVSWLLHYVHCKNLPFSVDDVKNDCWLCKNCAEIKPQFCAKPKYLLIKATRLLGRLSIDFQGPSTFCSQCVFTGDNGRIFAFSVLISLYASANSDQASE